MRWDCWGSSRIWISWILLLSKGGGGGGGGGGVDFVMLLCLGGVLCRVNWVDKRRQWEEEGGVSRGNRIWSVARVVGKGDETADECHLS